MVIANIIRHKKSKNKKINLTKQRQKKLKALYPWISIKSKRKKRRVRFLFRLDRFRQKLFNHRPNVEKMREFNTEFKAVQNS